MCNKAPLLDCYYEMVRWSEDMQHMVLCNICIRLKKILDTPKDVSPVYPLACYSLAHLHMRHCTHYFHVLLYTCSL